MDRLREDTLAAVDAVFDRFSARAVVPGFAWGVVADGVLVHAGGSGTRRVGEDLRPDEDSVFRIASMTKSFTAATVLLASRRRPARPRRFCRRLAAGRGPARTDRQFAGDHDPPPADDVGRAADRRSVGRPPARPRPRPLRRAAARWVQLRLDAGNAVRVLEPRLRDPRPDRDPSRGDGVSRRRADAPARTARDDGHDLPSGGRRGRPPCARLRAP